MRNEIASAARDLTWGIWRELGVPGVVRLTGCPVVDPEWLVVHTPFLALPDSRLDELAFAWCVHNHASISTRRVRAVASKATKEVSDAFWAWSSELRSHARVNWVDAREAKPSDRHVRRMVPDLGRTSMASLRARAVFGVGARADVVCALLEKKGEWIRTSDLVGQGYSKNAVAAVLKDLERAGLLSSAKRGNADVYKSAATLVLESLLDSRGAPWLAWDHVFGVMTTLVLLERAATKPDAVRLVEADQARRRVATSAAELGWPEPPMTSATPDGFESMLVWGLDRLNALGATWAGDGGQGRTRRS